MMRRIAVLAAGVLAPILALAAPGHAAPLKPPPVPMVPRPVAAQSGDPSNPAYAALYRRLVYLPPAELAVSLERMSEQMLEYLSGQQMVYTFIRQDPEFHAAFTSKAVPHFTSVYQHAQDACEAHVSALLADAISPADAVALEAFMRTRLWAGLRSSVMGQFNASSGLTASDESLDKIMDRNLAKARVNGVQAYLRSLAPPQRVALAREIMTPSWQRFARVQTTVFQESKACSDRYGRRPEVVTAAQEWLKPLVEKAQAKYDPAPQDGSTP